MHGAVAIVDTWLTTPFEGGRHVRRIQMIDEFLGAGAGDGQRLSSALRGDRCTWRVKERDP